jgi:hypothetical protein
MLISPWHLTANPAATQVAAGSGLQDYSGNVCDSAGNISRPQWSFSTRTGRERQGQKKAENGGWNERRPNILLQCQDVRLAGQIDLGSNLLWAVSY